MDISGLSKLSSDTLVLVVAVLGFMVCVPRVPSKQFNSDIAAYVDFRLRNRGIRSHR